MKAGRELDARVAEDVMKLLNVGRRNTGVGHETHLAYYLPSLKEYRTVPHYSTQIADAWLVVEKLLETNDHVDIERWCWAGWDVAFGGACATADTAPLAICLAAPKAVDGGADDE